MGNDEKKARVIVRWTSIPFSSNTPSCFLLQKPELNTDFVDTGGQCATAPFSCVVYWSYKGLRSVLTFAAIERPRLRLKN